MKRVVRRKWTVFGEYGGSFSNLDEAKKCAKFASTTPEHEYRASIFNEDRGEFYLDYENGKCVRDGWTLPPLKKTGEIGKFNLDGKIVQKPIYLLDGKECIKHNNQIIWVKR